MRKHGSLGRQIGDLPPHRHRLPLAIQPGDRRRAARRTQITQQQPQERRLPRSIGSEQSEDLTRRDPQRTLAKRRQSAVNLRKFLRFDDQSRILKGAAVKSVIIGSSRVPGNRSRRRIRRLRPDC
jgi:hypothetical protein